jgi:hypothetical protein
MRRKADTEKTGRQEKKERGNRDGNNKRGIEKKIIIRI